MTNRPPPPSHPVAAWIGTVVGYLFLVVLALAALRGLWMIALWALGV